MAEDLRQERSVIAQPIEDRSISRLWIIPASLLCHIFLVSLFFVQLPDKKLNAAPEEVVTLQLVPEPEQPASEEPAEGAQEPPEVEPEPEPEPGPEPEPEPEPEPAAAEPEPPQDLAQSEPDILPDVAIRPDVETQLDALDTQEQSEAQEEAAPSSEVEQGFGEAASLDGELPAGEFAPVPQQKPAEQESDVVLEEREPLSNQVIEQSGLRQILGDLPPQRRLNQICTIEAISQIRMTNASYESVRGVVAASDAGLKIDGGTMIARGGAFNLGGGRWVELEFDCVVDLDRYRVLRFSQRIGSELTADEVRARGFNRFE